MYLRFWLWFKGSCRFTRWVTLVIGRLDEDEIWANLLLLVLIVNLIFFIHVQIEEWALLYSWKRWILSIILIILSLFSYSSQFLDRNSVKTVILITFALVTNCIACLLFLS